MTASVALQTQSQPSSMELIQQALQAARESGLSASETAVIIKELVALRQSEERFAWEREERQSKIDFDDALNACQSQIGRIAPNQKRENNIAWADYVQLDRTVRPIYIKAGFSIGFSEVESEDKGRLRMRATVSRGGISREYFAEISRAPANSKMNQTDADAGAASRVKRYLLLSIFNIAVGIDKEEKAGFAPADFDPMPEGALLDWLASIEGAGDEDEAVKVFLDAHKAAGKDNEANLRIDCHSVKYAKNLKWAKALYNMAYAKWRNSNSGPEMEKVGAAWEEVKRRFPQGAK